MGSTKPKYIFCKDFRCNIFLRIFDKSKSSVCLFQCLINVVIPIELIVKLNTKITKTTNHLNIIIIYIKRWLSIRLALGLTYIWARTNKKGVLMTFNESLFPCNQPCKLERSQFKACCRSVTFLKEKEYDVVVSSA